MAEYSVKSTSQGTYILIKWTSDVIRNTYKMCRAGSARYKIDSQWSKGICSLKIKSSRCVSHLQHTLFHPLILIETSTSPPDSKTMLSMSYGTSYTHLRMRILRIPLKRFTSAVLHPRHTWEIILFGANAVNFSHSFPIFIMLRKSEMRADWEGQELPLKLQGSSLVHLCLVADVCFKLCGNVGMSDLELLFSTWEGQEDMLVSRVG